MSTAEQKQSEIMAELQVLISQYGRRDVGRCCLLLISRWAQQGIAFVEANEVQTEPKPEAKPMKRGLNGTVVSDAVNDVMGHMKRRSRNGKE